MNKMIFTYGFALFGMFFGAGNLVFPLAIGRSTSEHWLLGFFGLMITGIVLPFIGLFALKANKGNYVDFFGGAGKMAKAALPLLILSLIGSFGAMPRCITLVYGSVTNIIPDLPAVIFNFIFCAVTYFVCLSEQRITNLLGKYLAPALLVFLAILVILGVINGDHASAGAGILAGTGTLDGAQSFSHGFKTGYQTMDLLGAIFFSALIFSQVQRALPKGVSDSDTVKFAMKIGTIAMVLLAIMYLGMVFLGANFSDLITSVEPASIIMVIAQHLMGDYAMWCMSLLVALACFTTVVALNNTYAQYLCSLFNCKDNFKFVLLGTTAVAFFVSLFGFGAIAGFLSKILDCLYPSIVVLAIVSIFSKNMTLKTALFYGVLAAVLLCGL
ncbi:MAG: branched-chain amino acid transport system II carrier protein [Holosporaceae bacterium]|jgi:LIVCS family branched-chain amino acid:cation transporter|nr:branched-chain amino acid transport system II carrier protein [Holosporaceae bacterium]